jgi:DNA invertase Pin-like site-specific DNA recombinase/DnaJ-domain-containing protein 1
MNKFVDQVFRVAIYLRLSKEDGDLSFSTNGKAESDSINNQRDLILGYLAKHPEMEIIEEYKDDGKTGTNFDRAEFQRMLDDLKTGKVNCVIVKDLSRFGRDYIDCGYYIDKLFPELGIRFISINDNYDSSNASSSDNLVVPFKNLMNDSYSRDISMKVRSNFDAKRKRGDFISNFAPYGYVKSEDNKNQLVIDEYAAEIVRDIFKWKIDGLSPAMIAQQLNDMGILSPMEYKRSCGINFPIPDGSQPGWNHITVRRILQNEVYVGILAQGKRTTPNYKTKKFVYKSEDEWTRVEGTHTPIISRRDFELVQELLKEDTRACNGTKISPYCGRIFCADCGAPAVRRTVSTKDKKYVYYVCSANKADKKNCTKHSIREDVLESAVLATIQKQIEAVIELDRVLNEAFELAWERSEIQKIEASLEIQNEQLRKNNMLRLSIYEDLQQGLVDKDEYKSIKEELTARIAEAMRAIDELNRMKAEIAEGLAAKQSWMAQFKEFSHVSEISRKLIVHLVEKILIYENAEIEIIFRQADKVASAYQFIEEQKRLQEGSKILVMPRLEVV